MGKHAARWSVRGHSLGGHNLCRPPGSSTGLRKGGARPRSATDAPFSQAPAQRDRTHARVRLPTPTRKWGAAAHAASARPRSRSPPRHTVGGRWRRGGRPPSPYRGRETEASPRALYRLDPPQESHSRDTPPRRRPRGARWGKGTTPPLGLARLRDDLERSRGTTEDRASHAHAPAAGARRSGGTAPTDAGRTAREAHAKEAKRGRLLRPRTTAPPTP